MLNLKSFEDFLNESINKKIKIENQDKFYNFLIDRTSISKTDSGVNCLVINDVPFAQKLEAEFNMKLEEEMKKSSCIKTKLVRLDPYQEIALKNIDALKEEMVNMVRKKRDSGKDSFELIPEKANKLHDDRSYCMALCAWFLSEKRAERIRNKKRNFDYKIIDMLPVTPRKQVEKIFG